MPRGDEVHARGVCLGRSEEQEAVVQSITKPETLDLKIEWLGAMSDTFIRAVCKKCLSLPILRV